MKQILYTVFFIVMAGINILHMALTDDWTMLPLMVAYIPCFIMIWYAPILDRRRAILFAHLRDIGKPTSEVVNWKYRGGHHDA